jgi:hypothetical protein
MGKQTERAWRKQRERELTRRQETVQRLAERGVLVPERADSVVVVGEVLAEVTKR